MYALLFVKLSTHVLLEPQSKKEMFTNRQTKKKPKTDAVQTFNFFKSLRLKYHRILRMTDINSFIFFF